MINNKIKSKLALKNIIKRLKQEKKKIVFTNGCFDILHYGHVRYLEQAKAHGNILVVAVNSDGSVRRLKGDKRPLFHLRDRMRVLAALESVDYVTYFNEETPAEIITILKPDIVIKGGDYKPKDIVGCDIVKRWGGKAKSVNFQKGYSVTSIIKRISKAAASA